MNSSDRQPASAAQRANNFPWPPILLALAIIAAWLLGRTRPLAWPGLDDMPGHIIGSGFGLAGLALVVWSVIALNRAGTTFMPDGVSSALVTNGPYARFRNPIYLGEVLFLLGVAELTKNIWFAAAAAAFAILVTLLQILPEERHLSATFGTAYDDYRARTRRWL